MEDSVSKYLEIHYFIHTLFLAHLFMNRFRVGRKIDIYIARVSGWSQNIGPSFESNQYNIWLVSKKGLNNELHDLPCPVGHKSQEEEEEIC